MKSYSITFMTLPSKPASLQTTTGILLSILFIAGKLLIILFINPLIEVKFFAQKKIL
jgi:hypothetical protein